ncbi:MAG: branched-chain amino acid ABC transporter permease, partial [Betaproteobacteria bacterium]|nr:branched-chain amino acid ABC transporter permease [Betaproteobacteria bacterium]
MHSRSLRKGEALNTNVQSSIAPTVPANRDIDWPPLLLVPALMLLALPFVGSPSTWLTLTVAGLAMGMIVFVIASGLTLVFGLMDVLHFGHGVFIALGAFVATSVFAAMGGFASTESLLPNLLAVFAAMVAAMAVTTILGLVFERLLVRPVYGMHLKQILITMGG